MPVGELAKKEAFLAVASKLASEVKVVLLGVCGSPERLPNGLPARLLASRSSLRLKGTVPLLSPRPLKDPNNPPLFVGVGGKSKSPGSDPEGEPSLSSPPVMLQKLSIRCRLRLKLKIEAPPGLLALGRGLKDAGFLQGVSGW